MKAFLPQTKLEQAAGQPQLQVAVEYKYYDCADRLSQNLSPAHSLHLHNLSCINLIDLNEHH
jgi:hypothetical protein